MQNITLMDYERVHGYRVRIMRNGKKTSKLFSFAKYGGRIEALEAAKQWRDSIKRELGQKSPFPSCAKKSKKSKAMVGVYKGYDQNGKGRKYPFWSAVICYRGKRKSKKFYIKVHGDKEAKLLAMRERKKMEEKIKWIKRNIVRRSKKEENTEN